MTADNHRKIIHIDMDAFFASVEQRDFPELRGKPIAVGGSKERGVVAAASYEARKYGVHSAMPSRIAAQKCPNLIFVKHRFHVYKAVSKQIREIFRNYTDLVEPLSLDEAFLDVSENKFQIDSAIFIAREIKKEIKEVTGLTASAGVSVNKFLAKVASDIHKPDGLTVILPEQVQVFLEQLPIEKFFGVGKATAKKMAALRIKSGHDLKQYSKIELAQLFGKFGTYLYHVVRGEDNRPVKPNRIRKSISSERTFGSDIYGLENVKSAANTILEKVAANCKRLEIKGKTVNLKLRWKDFTTITRSRTVGSFTNDEVVIRELVFEMLYQVAKEEMQPVRLIGIGLSSLNVVSKSYQLELFDEEE